VVHLQGAGAEVMPIITFDLDSTLADTRARRYLINREGPTDWRAYSMACSSDEPIAHTVALWHALAPTYNLAIVTARNILARGLTEEWLLKHHIRPDLLLMASDEQATMDHGEYKKVRVLEAGRRLSGHVTLHIDDWPPVADALAEIGVPCLMVTPPSSEGPGNYV